MPPATVTSSPVTWPESSSEARTTTARAMSSATRDLLQRHRPRHAHDVVGVELPARHLRHGPAGRDRVHARERRDPDDLVLQAQEQTDLDRGLRGRVVGVVRLAEAAGGRADEDEIPVPVALDLAEERARGEERRGEIRAQCLLPALERDLPDRLLRARPHAGDGGADVDLAERLARAGEQRVDLVFRPAGRRRARAARRAPPTAPRPARGRSCSGSRRARPRPRMRARTRSRSRPSRR